VLFIVSFASTKERIQPDPKQESSLGQDLADWLRTGRGSRCPGDDFYFIAIVMRSSVMLPFSSTRRRPKPLQLFNRLRPGLAAGRVAVSSKLSARFGKRSLFIAAWC